MSTAIFKRSCAALLLVVLLVPATALVAPQRAYAIVTTEVGPLLVAAEAEVVATEADVIENAISAVKNTASYLLDITSTAAEYAQYIKAYVLDPLAFIMGGNLLKSITSSILGFVNKNKLYVQNLPGYLQNVGDVQAYAFLNQFSSTSNSPFASTITSSLRSNYLQQTSMAGFFAANRNTLSQSSPNYKSFLAGNWSQGGASAWFALTTQDQNNPYLLYYRTQDQLTRSVQNMTAAKLAQLNWGRGFLSWCGSGVNTTSALGADDEGGYGGDTTCTSWDIDGYCTSGPLNDDDDYYGGGEVDCPVGTVRAGSGGCANTNTHQFELPTGYSCPTDTDPDGGSATFDGNWGGCRWGDGTITVPNDASGNPAYPAASSAAQDFDGSGDAYDGKSDTATAGDGTAKFSTAGKNLSATTDLKRLDAILTEASKSLPEGYRVEVSSAQRGGGGASAHDSGSAVDIRIYEPGSSTPLPNRGDSSATGVYRDLAVAAYNAQQKLYPELGTKTLRWGGCFDTSIGYRNGEKDGMHFDLTGGSRPQGRYCSNGLRGVAAGGPVSLAPQSPKRVAVVSLPVSGAAKSSVVGSALGHVWNLAPTAAASHDSSTAASFDCMYAGDPTCSSITKIPQPGDPCTRPDGTQGKIETPGSVIKDFLSDILGLNAKKVTMIGDIGASISGILSNVATVLKTVDMAAGLFGADGGLGSVGGTSSYDSPFADYLNSDTYMGLSTSDIKDPGTVVDNTVAAAAICNTTLGSSGCASGLVCIANNSSSTAGTCIIPPPPTATLTASLASITLNQSSLLTWSSTYATSCTGTGFSTGNTTSGSVSVFPSVTTTYSITCTGTSGTSSTSATVTVSAVIDTTPDDTTTLTPDTGSEGGE